MHVKSLAMMAALASAMLLGACGGKSGEGNSAAPSGAPVAAVAPPQGKKWSDVVSATPEGGYLMGNPNAALKLVEFASFTCPHCRDFARDADKPLTEDYVNSGKLSFEFRPFLRDPVDITVAMVAICPGPDVFFPLKNQLFVYQDELFKKLQAQGNDAFKQAAEANGDTRFVKLAELAGLIDFARQNGLPEPQVRACLANWKTAEALARNNERASEQYNVVGTPTFILNGAVLENTATWPVLQQKLKEAGA